jgi:hypothetical protein
MRTDIRGRQAPPDDRVKRFSLNKSGQSWLIATNEDITPSR